MVGLLVATVFGVMSVSATVNNNQDEKPVLSLNFEDTGDIGVFVFYEQPGKTNEEDRIIVIPDANVKCIDVNGGTHEMIYEEIEPGFYAYVATDVPVGECKITASKAGYSTVTIDANVFSNGFDVYRIELEKNQKSRFAYQRLIDIFLSAFPILRILLII